MCTPAIGIGLQVVSGVVGFLGKRAEGAAAQSQQNYQAHIARNNAIIAQNNQITAQQLADDARVRGEQERQAFSDKVKRAQGSATASMAANGVLVDSGSALDLVNEIGDIGRLDALTIRSNAEREAHGFEVQGANFAAQSANQEAQARLHVFAGENAKRQANSAAFGSLLGSAGGVAGKWFNFSQAGAV